MILPEPVAWIFAPVPLRLTPRLFWPPSAEAPVPVTVIVPSPTDWISDVPPRYTPSFAAPVPASAPPMPIKVTEPETLDSIVPPLR